MGDNFLFFSFEDLDSIHGNGEWVMHNCHRVPLAGTQTASKFLGWRNWFLLSKAGIALHWWQLGRRLSALLPW